MKKMVMLMAAVVVVGIVVADIYRTGPAREINLPDLKLRVCGGEHNRYEITEDAALFCAHFATVYYPEYHINYAEQRLLAVEVAKTVARFLGSTNDIRIVHWEQPTPASTNLIDQIEAKLKGKYITDEIIPLKPKAVGGL